MEQQIKLFRVFIASPSDLADERRALRDVVEKTNAIFSKDTGWRIELLGWEDTFPAAGRPQELINADLDKADLFIGCIWKRWGSNSGNDGKTGFEEEFERSWERRAKNGSPEMWLFFKEIDAVTRGDPGPQLREVLAFRDREIEAKRLLFKEFSDTAAWRDMVTELLQRRMLRLATPRPSEAKDVQSTGTLQGNVQTIEADEQSAKSQPKSPAAFASLAAILKHAAQAVHATKLPVFDQTEALSAEETARLLLFAATIYDRNMQRVQFGTHEINSVYLHRTTLNMTPLERSFLLRTILLDKSLTKPGWFWVNESKTRFDIWLWWFASPNSEEGTRVRAIEVATSIGFPLYRRIKKVEPPISSLLGDEHASVRLAALRHLATLGREIDLRMIEPLLRDDNKDVRTQAERTTRLVRLRVDPDGEMKKSITQRDPFDEGIAEAVGRIAETISETTLVMALTHSSGALAAIAAKQLLKRGSVTPELARVMCESEAKAIRECGFIAQIGQGQAIDSSQIRSVLREPYFSYLSDSPWWNKGDAEAVLSAYFDRLTVEELWKGVYSFKDNSHLALRAIGRRFFDENVVRIRAELHDDFQKLADTLNKNNPEIAGLRGLPPLLPLFGDPKGAVETARKRLRIAALEVLVDHPVQGDRELFMRFLPAEYGDFGQTVACLRGLSCVGRAEDREKIVPLLSDSTALIQAAAARAYLALSPNSVVAAKDLLNEPTEYRVWIVVGYALKKGERLLWPLLRPLLGHNNEAIRRLVCYYAVCTLNKKATEKLLNEYLGRGGYFYNVVTVLDRALYAPKILRKAFMDQERAFFEEWRPSATWQWEEQ